MANILIDSDISADSAGNTQPRSLVWKSPTTGYIFFIDSSADLHYRKTTDSGASWGTEVSVRTGTVQKFAIWYDKWTKDDTGDIIHIAFVDSGLNDITYNSLDTSDDSLGGEVTTFSGSTADTVQDWANSCVSIVKERGGNVYVG